MEASLPFAISSVGTLIPLAVYIGKSCFGRVRDGSKIKKQILLLPPGSGKTTLTKRLSFQRQYLIIDLDEVIRSLCDNKTIRHMDDAKREGLDHEADLTYTECALEVLEKTKARLKADKTLKVLFVSSSYRFASHFKRDSIVVVAPNKEAFEKHIHDKPAEERERLRKERNAFISSVPNPKAIQTFSTHEELEKALRLRLGIPNVL